MVNFTAESTALVKNIEARVEDTGEEIAEGMHLAADTILEWVGHLHASETTGHCDHCLDGVRSLILEAVCGASAGLYRSAILSMRGQIDLSLTWLYFKDHPVEWERVCRENEGYKLKKDSFEYLREYYPGFKQKFALLENSATRKLKDPYRILSAHIHSIGIETIPVMSSFKDIVGDKSVCEECISLQRDVSEYVGDIFLSCYGGKWASLPNSIIQKTKSRVEEDKRAVIFAD